MNKFIECSTPLVIGHRGASAHAPENTLAAFRRTVELGADAVELDAKLTADQKVVVIHDQTVDRTTGVHGVVNQMTLSQIKKLDAGSFFDAEFTGEPIPTLEEVFFEVGQHTYINIELTNYTSPNDPLPDLVSELVLKHEMQDRVIFSSFNTRNLWRIRRLLPKTPVAILTTAGSTKRIIPGLLGRLASPRFVNHYFTDVNQRFVTVEHGRGRKINVWTVNDPIEMKRLFNLGIDGIITDDPSLARQVLEEKA